VFTEILDRLLFLLDDNGNLMIAGCVGLKCDE
jgi:hypothetical protein